MDIYIYVFIWFVYVYVGNLDAVVLQWFELRPTDSWWSIWATQVYEIKRYSCNLDVGVELRINIHVVRTPSQVHKLCRYIDN